MNELLSSLKLTLLHTGFAKLNHTWGFKKVISPFVRVFLVTKGQAGAFYEGKEFILKPNYIYLIPSFTYNDYWCDNYHEQFYVGFFEEIKLGMSIFNQKKMKYEIEANETDYDLFERLLALNKGKSVLNDNPRTHINNDLKKYQNNKGLHLKTTFETEGILAILLSRFVDEDDAVVDKSTFKGDLNKVIIYIGKNLDKDLKVADLARLCDLSADHFSKSFLSKFDVQPNKYIQLKRIERAQFLLLTTEDSLLDISNKVGMQSLSYFSKKFKEKVGLTPAKFRKQQLNL